MTNSDPGPGQPARKKKKKQRCNAFGFVLRIGSHENWRPTWGIWGVPTYYGHFWTGMPAHSLIDILLWFHNLKKAITEMFVCQLLHRGAKKLRKTHQAVSGSSNRSHCLPIKTCLHLFRRPNCNCIFEAYGPPPSSSQLLLLKCKCSQPNDPDTENPPDPPMKPVGWGLFSLFFF